MSNYPQSHPKHCEDDSSRIYWNIDNGQAENLDKYVGDMQKYHDSISHPTHYTYGTIEAKDYINSCGYGEGFNLGCAIKYITRCCHKGEKIKDLQKAITYLQFEIERERSLRE